MELWLVRTMLNLIREDYQVYGSQLSRRGLWVMVVYRFGRWAHEAHPAFFRTILTLLYRYLNGVALVLTGVDLPCEATVGRRFKIHHVGGIVISGEAVFGDDVIVHQGVTVDVRRTGEGGAPVIGNRVDIGAGAKILGHVVVGDDVMIGSNAVVISDVPANSIAVGVPAKVRSRTNHLQETSNKSFRYSLR
jgi:serine O-acetyltransferase